MNLDSINEETVNTEINKKSTGNFLEDNFESFDAKTFREESPLISKIGFKMSIAPYIGLACGIVCGALFPNVFGLIVAAAFIFLSLWVIVNVKDFQVMDIREKSIVIYTTPEALKVVRIPYDEIVEWEIQNDTVSRIKFITDKGLTVFVNTFQLDKAWRHLYKIMPKKEMSAIVRQQVNDKKINVGEALKKLFKL